MAVDIAEIKRLRELTGVGMADAKQALHEANGDFDKALAAMRKKGLTKAEKRPHSVRPKCRKTVPPNQIQLGEP